MRKTIATIMLLGALFACGCDEDPCPTTKNSCGADAGIDGRFDPTSDVEGAAVYFYDLGFKRTESALIRVRSNAAHRLSMLWAPGCVLENVAPTYEDPNVYLAHYETPITCEEANLVITDAEVQVHPCGHGTAVITANGATASLEW